MLKLKFPSRLIHVYDIIINHFSISKPSTIYCVLVLLCYGPVYSNTGPVTANTNPVTVYTCPVPTNKSSTG